MKDVMIVTYVPFWTQGAGYFSRIYSLVNYFSKHTRVTVVYAGNNETHDRELASKLPFDFTLLYLCIDQGLPLSMYPAKFLALIKGVKIDVCIIEHIDITMLVDVLPEDVCILLDTHDLLFQRNASFEEFGMLHNSVSSTLMEITKEQEIDAFRKYDAIILINPIDQELVLPYVEKDRILVAPHSANFKPHNNRATVRSIGFVASSYAPNIDAITTFVQDVWHARQFGEDLKLTIYGNICNELSNDHRFQRDDVLLLGYLPDLDRIYDEIDIVINPVRFGCGMKIKTIEALANGLPLITTTHGARGLEKGRTTAYLVANSAEEFSNALRLLTSDFRSRQRLATGAQEFVLDNLTPEKCYDSIRHFIDSFTNQSTNS
jgi:glycosyltransferase involved in cell wall biosynthesis